ncbi:MAG: EMC3/TMCO1 family protein [Candidatus Odinarchaeota archaeon]
MSNKMDPWSDFIQAIASLFQPMATPPWSGILIVLVNIGLALISIWATNKFTDVEKMKQDMAEVKAWQDKMKAARKSMDPVALQEVINDQGRIMRLNSSMMGARMKPMCYFYIPFILVFTILGAIFQGGIVAVLPFNIDKALPFLTGMLGAPTSAGFGLSFYGFYLLVGFGLGNLIRKPFGQSMMT